MYFRNALVRSNYFNNYLNIKEDSSYLVKFYENLLLGKNNNLKVKDYLNSAQFDALDSLNRIDEFIADGDLECLNSVITTEDCNIEQII